MYTKDLIGLVVSYAYVLFVVFSAEAIWKRKNYPKEFLRKFVHIAIGSWIIPAAFLFDYWYIAIIPPATFVVTNYISYKKRLFKSVEREAKVGKAGYGMVYFPVSFCLLIYLYWRGGLNFIACVGLMALAWGDGLATVLGLRFGKHKYRIGDTTKSIEGNIAMFLSSLVTTIFVFLLFIPMNIATALLLAIPIAAVAALVEAVSVKELDNLSVPILASFVCYILFI